MDEAMENHMTTAGVAEGTHILTKEREYTVKTGNTNVVDSHDLITPSGGDHNESSIRGKNLDRIGSSEQASVSPHCIDDSGVMVEELTFKNFDGEYVGTSNHRERLQNNQNWLQNLYQKIGGSGSPNSHGEVADRGKNWEIGDVFFPGVLDQSQSQKPLCENYDPVLDVMPGNLSNIFSSGVTRTKMLSKSGSSEYFVKNSLKGKGIIFKGPVRGGLGDSSGNKTSIKSTTIRSFGSNASLSSTLYNVTPVTSGFAEAWPIISTNSSHDGVILRDRLKAGQGRVNKMENLQIFRQIVKLVNFSHAQGVALHNLWPSYFKLLSSNQIMYLGSSIQIGLSKNVSNQDVQQLEHDQIDKRTLEQNLLPFDYHCAKKQKLVDGMIYAGRLPHCESRSDLKSTPINVSKGDNFLRTDFRNLSGSHMLEEKWYSSPEQVSGSHLAFSSNIYSLGVLLFELLSSFDSRRSHEVAMSNLRHRILPPNFLSENPKEAGFCLWLLHPESSSRPTTREILQSGVICDIQDSTGGELVSCIEERDAESELLLNFLSSLEEKKQKDASKLAKEIRFIEADIEEVKKRQTKESPVCSSAQDSLSAKGNEFLHKGHSSSNLFSKLPFAFDDKLKKNIWQLENAYFSMRSSIQHPEKDVRTRGDTELLRVRENWLSGKDRVAGKTKDRLGGFYTGFCKYARYGKFRVRGVLRNGDLANPANVICSSSFDRDEDYLAVGGVSKKIKIFEFNSLFDHSVDIHYPVVEMSNKSKLSCICWNSYIRNYLASTDYDGAVKLWDAATSQGFSEFTEHDERAWSVDFSRLDPTKFASGSDDRLVKLWSINEKKSLCTIRNNANVCCVQFSAESAYLLAFSSADYKTYCYDLRNISTPWCILAGHEKAVSYAKFLDAETLVTASTDNSLKIWDLKKTSSNCWSRDACVLTLRGHTNEKNFVGLSIADGYIACGSETNEVFAYYRSLPMPITSMKFGSIDPISGRETDDDNGQFVSSVCWRRKSNMVIAANSTGCIKLLEMV